MGHSTRLTGEAIVNKIYSEGERLVTNMFLASGNNHNMQLGKGFKVALENLFHRTSDIDNIALSFAGTGQLIPQI